MSKLFTGSICLSDLNFAAKRGHSAFSKAANGKIYVNVVMWENDSPDKYENTHAVQINPKKDSTDEKFYLGNFKPVKKSDPENLTQSDYQQLPDDDDLPF